MEASENLVSVYIVEFGRRERETWGRIAGGDSAFK